MIRYDRVLLRKNFKTYNSPRAEILFDILKERNNINFETAAI